MRPSASMTTPDPRPSYSLEGSDEHFRWPSVILTTTTEFLTRLNSDVMLCF